MATVAGQDGHRVSRTFQAALQPWYQALRAVIWPFVLARLAYALWGAILVLTVGAQDDVGNVIRAAWPPAGPVGAWLEKVLLTPWFHYDAHFYVDIAVHGYAQPGTAGFYPVTSLLLRAATFLVHPPMTAAMLLNLLLQLALLVVMYRFIQEEFSASTARWSVLGLLTFPLAFLLAVPYSETTFMLASVVALWAGSRRRWLVAAIAAALAAGTRQPGLFLLPALGLEWLIWAIRERRLLAWASGLFLGLIPVLPLSFTFYLYSLGFVHGSLLQPLQLVLAVVEIQDRYWYSRFVMPWRTMELIARDLGHSRLLAIDLFWGVLLTALVLLSLRLWRRPEIVAYALLLLFFTWTKVVGPPSSSVIQSLPRRLLVILPLYPVVGAWLERHRLARVAWFPLAVLLFLAQSAMYIRNTWIP